MVELSESIYLPSLRPVLTIIGGSRVLESINKIIVQSSFDSKMDYESVDFNHNFEIRRDAKMFEKYVVQGILKLSWTTKCRKFIPAGILLVFDWCGNGIDSPILESPDWKSKENTILKFLRKFKDQCKGRLVKIGIICLLGTTNEEITIDEKLTLLKKTGEIDSKSILLLKNKIEENDQMTKFKKYLYDGCISHYKDEIERLKKLKSRAHKELSGNFIELQIRYNFKLGYLSELRQDKESALNFYKKSYKELQDPGLDSSIQIEEKRSVADLVVHRMQCLLLSPPHLLGRLKEAISLFKSHANNYRLSTTKSTSLFDSWKWLSEHFSRFGSLLDKIPAEIYEKDNFWTHPGFYYMVSGIYYIVRMKLSVEDSDFIQSVTNWQGFIVTAGLRIKDPIFIGQNKALASHPLQKDMIEGISIADQVKIIKILEESEVKHLQLALEFMFKALKFYKSVVQMNKISLYLSFMLSELYKKKNEPDSSYQYKSEIVQKMEGWDKIQGFVTNDLITYAESLNKVPDILQWTLKSLDLCESDKGPMFCKLKNTLESNLTQIKYKGLILAKASFESKSISCYSSVKLTVKLTNLLPSELRPVKVSLLFSETSFNTEFAQEIALLPNQIEVIEHTLVIKSPNMTTLNLLKIIARYEPVALSYIDFEIDTKAKLAIISPPPQLSPTFNHLPPALIGENYIININLHPYSQISNVKMTIYEEEKEIGQRRRAASIDRNFENNYNIFDLEGKTIEEGVSLAELESATTIPLKILFYEEKNYNLKAKFSYTVHKPNEITYKAENIYDLDITVQPPFQFKIRWLSNIEVNSSGVMNIKLWNICSLPIYLYKILLIPDAGWTSDSVKVYEKLEIVEGNVISEDFVIKSNTESPCTLCGNLLVTWSRKEGIVNDCRIPISPVESKYFPIDLIVTVSSEANLGQVFELGVKVVNKMKLNLEVKLVLEESNFFLVGGFESFKFELKEEGEKMFQFILVGIEPGMLDLPRISVNIPEVKRTWQGKIFILP